MPDQIQQCAQLIHEAKNIAVLTGAGISTNAGIPDFRGPQGLYITRRYDPEKVFDIGHFYQDQKPFYEFARDFIELEKTIQPTLTHKFLAKLEKAGKLSGVITQNIDALHQMAGSKNVYEVHGSFWESFCLDCDQRFSYEQMRNKLTQEDVAHCECNGILKPNIVFFGENVKHLVASENLAYDSDLFFVLGTSCVVFPAAMIPHYAGGKIVIVNKGEVQLKLPNIVLNVQGDCDDFFQNVEKELAKL